MDVGGRVIVVTGAARRVGRAIARRLAAAGARVAIHYRHSRAAALDLVEELGAAGCRVMAVQADLCRPEEVERMVGEVVRAWGPVEGLVNNASEFFPTPFATLDLADWDRLLGANLWAPMLCCRAVVPAMLERGAGVIVNLADSLRPRPGYVPYVVSKAGLVALTEGLARELAPAIRVNGVAPGAVLPPEGTRDEEIRRLVATIPAGRLGCPDDVAEAVLYLLEADYVTGHVLTVDGGRSLA